jgi:cobalt-zinc-cadmium efflux system protein
MGSLSWEAIQRLQAPAQVDAGTVMLVAGVGVVINGVTAWLLLAGSKQDLNIRRAFLHMAADALVSMGVVLAAGLYLWRGWNWIDPAVSLLIALAIIVGTWSLLRQSLHLLFDGVPDDIDLDTIRQSLLNLPGVASNHDLHVWAMSTTDNALTVHLVCDDNCMDQDELLGQAMDVLRERFEIRHVSLQCESRDFATRCAANHERCMGV